jgi:hypothetical protein
VVNTAVRKGLIVVVALVLVGKADVLLADVSMGSSTLSATTRPSVAGADFFPLCVAAYRSEGAACEGRAVSGDEIRSVGQTYSSDSTSSQTLLGEDGAETSLHHRYLPVLLSLLVPGTGEIYMGYYVRGVALVGVEVAAWTGYSYYHNMGLDSRADYEKFADSHWNYDKWVDDHALWRDPEYVDVDPKDFAALDSIGSNYWEGWPAYHTWHSKEEEKQNYYENIGKYDWFISGWEDWDPVAQPRDSDMRTTYRAMRKESNDELDKATEFIYLSIAARVFSLVETVLLARREDDRRDDAHPTGENPSSGFSIETRATGIASGEVALVYRFR